MIVFVFIFWKIKRLQRTKLETTNKKWIEQEYKVIVIKNLEINQQKKKKKRGKIMSSSVATDRIDFAETIL